jgi:hypothetical protein
VTVTSVAVDVGNRRAAQIGAQLVGALSHPLPHRLEPGASASWAYPITVDDEIRRNCPRLRAMVCLGTGRTIYSKRR